MTLALSNHHAACGLVFRSYRAASADPSVDDAGKVNAVHDRFPSGNNYPVVCDPYAIRRKHPQHWMAFLHAHFPDVLTVKWTFGVDDNTARNWWHGKVGPQGWAVEFAIKAIPNAAQWLEAA